MEKSDFSLPSLSDFWSSLFKIACDFVLETFLLFAVPGVGAPMTGQTFSFPAGILATEENVVHAVSGLV